MRKQYSELKKVRKRKIRHTRVRGKISGTKEKPRIAVFRSLAHIYAQVIDDVRDTTLVSASDLQLKAKKGTKVEIARNVGELLGQRMKEKGVKIAVFDRGGYKYHGRVQALAEGVRSEGITF